MGNIYIARRLTARAPVHVTAKTQGNATFCLYNAIVGYLMS